GLSFLREPLIGTGEREAGGGERRRETRSTNGRIALAREGRDHVRARRGEVEVACSSGLAKRAALRVDSGDRDNSGIRGRILRRSGRAVVSDRGNDLNSTAAQGGNGAGQRYVVRPDQAD